MSVAGKKSIDTPTDSPVVAMSDNPSKLTGADVARQAESVTCLPVPEQVANHFFRIAHDPETSLEDFHSAIASDASLTSMFLSLANQPPFCTDRSTTRVSAFTDQLGLETTSALAVAYALAGRFNASTAPSDLHNALWTASLFKAVVARQFSLVANPIMREQAFICGLLQDIFVPWLVARTPLDKAPVASIADIFENVESQDDLFGCSHAELGGKHLSRLGLPQLYCNAVTFHHDLDALTEHVGDAILAEAIQIASRLPHVLDGSHSEDLSSLREEVAARVDLYGLSSDEFWKNVRLEFDALRSPMSHRADGVTTEELLRKTSVVHAAGVTILVRNMSSVLTQSADIAAKATGLRSQCDQLETKATVDQLTDILNRAGFTEMAEKRLQDAGILNVPVSLVFCDCNKFKQINDNFGHDYGDQALIIAATAMKSISRKFDVVGRLGGDEFVALLFDRTKDQAIDIVRQILADVASQTINAGGEQIRFSLSAGIAHVQHAIRTTALDDLLHRGDQLMYEAKRGEGEKIRAVEIVPNDKTEQTPSPQEC